MPICSISFTRQVQNIFRSVLCMTDSRMRDGYIIGGGYPELFVKRAGGKRPYAGSPAGSFPEWYSGLRGVRWTHVPDRSYDPEKRLARCSGEDQDYEMCGVFTGETRMPSRRVVSYVEGTSTNDSPLGQHPSGVMNFITPKLCFPGTRVCLPALPRGWDPG